MFLSIVLVIVALSISAVAAYYSIAGLTAIFSAAVLPIIIMGIVLEIGKIGGVVWLHYNWKRAPLLMKAYLVPGILALMLITSMGIYGFLSKAHLDQTISAGDNTIKIEQIQAKIDREKARIKNAEAVLQQLDKSVDVLIKYDRIRGATGAIATREKQKAEREKLATIINDAQDKISALLDEQAKLKAEQVGFEAEVGPVKYIAALFNDGSVPSAEEMEKAIRYVIIIIVLVFDPLAIILILAATEGFKWAKRDDKNSNTLEVMDNDGELEKLQEQLTEYEQRASIASNKMYQLAEENAKLQQQKDELADAMAKLEMENVHFRGLFNDAESETNDAELKDLHEKLANITKEKEKTEAEYKALLSDIKAIEQDLQDLPSLQKLVKEQEETIKKLEADLQNKETVTETNADTTALLNRIKELEHRLQLVSQSSNMDLNLVVENDRLKQRISDLEWRIEQSRQQHG